MPSIPAQRFGLSLAVDKGTASLEQLTLKEPVGEAIFNGQDLTGWWTPGNIKAWGIKDGEMVKPAAPPPEKKWWHVSNWFNKKAQPIEALPAANESSAPDAAKKKDAPPAPGQ